MCYEQSSKNCINDKAKLNYKGLQLPYHRHWYMLCQLTNENYTETCLHEYHFLKPVSSELCMFSSTANLQIIISNDGYAIDKHYRQHCYIWDCRLLHKNIKKLHTNVIIFHFWANHHSTSLPASLPHEQNYGLQVWNHARDTHMGIL